LLPFEVPVRVSVGTPPPYLTKVPQAFLLMPRAPPPKLVENMSFSARAATTLPCPLSLAATSAIPSPIFSYERADVSLPCPNSPLVAPAARAVESIPLSPHAPPLEPVLDIAPSLIPVDPKIALPRQEIPAPSLSPVDIVPRHIAAPSYPVGPSRPQAPSSEPATSLKTSQINLPKQSQAQLPPPASSSNAPSSKPVETHLRLSCHYSVAFTNVKFSSKATSHMSACSDYRCITARAILLKFAEKRASEHFIPIEQKYVFSVPQITSAYAQACSAPPPKPVASPGVAPSKKPAAYKMPTQFGTLYRLPCGTVHELLTHVGQCSHPLCSTVAKIVRRSDRDCPLQFRAELQVDFHGTMMRAFAAAISHLSPK